MLITRNKKSNAIDTVYK